MIFPFHGVASISKPWETRLGAVSRNSDRLWPLQEKNPAEAEEDVPTAQVRQVNARPTEWEAKNGAVFDIIILYLSGPAEALL